MNWQAINQVGIEVKEREGLTQPEIAFSCIHYREEQAGYIHRFTGIDSLDKLTIVCVECHDKFSAESFIR